ncbi:hypothetical protein ACFLZY_03515 [Patescibacteria group bacterium]
MFGLRKNGAERAQKETIKSSETKESKSVLGKLKTYKEALAFLALFMISGTDLQKAQASVEGPEAKITQKADDSESSINWPDFRFTFTELTDEGEIELNPWSILAPVQLELSQDVDLLSKANIHVPYTYARAFEKDPASGQPLNPEDHEKARAHIENELKKQFADILHGLDVSKRVYHKDHPVSNLNQAQVETIRVVGTTSPEAEDQSSVKPGNIDAENIRLAQARAEAAFGITKEQLEEIGISLDDLQQSAEQVTSEEIQFSEDELRELAQIAGSQKGVDDLENIFKIIIAYNQDKIKDQAVLDRLDQIIGSKRAAEIEIEVKGQRKETVLIPLPLLLLLPLLLPGFRRRDQEQKPEPAQVPPEWDPNTVEIPDSIADTPLPPEDSQEFESMEDQTVIEDLYPNFDDQAVVARGLDYRGLVQALETHHDRLPDNEAREAYLAALLLETWRNHDLESRRQAGWDEGHLEENLDYENQPQQIRWARMHARVMRELVEAHQRTPEADYFELLTERTRQHTQRRTLTQGQ